MPHAHYNAICETVRRITDVRKTYLPQCLARKVTEAPVQELALVLEMAAYQQSVRVLVGEGLPRVQPLERTWTLGQWATETFCFPPFALHVRTFVVRRKVISHGGCKKLGHEQVWKQN